jgi:hypothetical protein
MFEFARKNFCEAGDEKFQKWCFFQSKNFSFKWLKINVNCIFFIFYDIRWLFWKFVKSRKRNEAGIPSAVTLNEEISHSTKESTELFAKHFGSVYCKDEIASEQDLADLYNISISEVTAPMFLIHKKLCNLKPDKSSGPDDLPPIFFRGCATALTYPLYLIFNKSLTSEVFPDIWKTAHITPIHKSGCISDVEIYRPISLLCTVSKVLESIVTNTLFETFKGVILPE